MSAPQKLTWQQGLAVLAAGGLFGFGLALSTMVKPEVVLSFLRFQDMGLALVMGGGVLVTLVGYKLVPRWLKQPLLGGRGISPHYDLPEYEEDVTTLHEIDEP